MKITVLQPRVAKNKQDAIFYAGRTIAEVEAGNRTYVLTTAGEYSFRYKGHDVYRTESGLISEASAAIKQVTPLTGLTDQVIKKLSDEDQISNWGWFGINQWINGTCQITPTDVYSKYDEALAAFKAFVKNDLSKIKPSTIRLKVAGVPLKITRHPRHSYPRHRQAA
jgi:hypothetical protein